VNGGSVSVIVVTYNSRDDITACINSIPDACELIVIDNGSKDGTVQAVQNHPRSPVVIQNETNFGFGAANNQGLRLASRPFALLLNPDAFAHPGAIERLEQVMRDQPEAAACGGKLLNPDGSLQQSACRELTLWAVFTEQTLLEKLFNTYWISGRFAQSNEPVRVAQVMGACLMMRRFDGEFAMFDERFFLYCEDTELCKRLAEKGRILYVPDAVFTHRLGTSSVKDRARAVRMYNRGKEMYFKLHHGAFQALICFLLDRFGALLRLAIWILASAGSLFLWKAAVSRVRVFAKVLFGPIDPYRASTGHN